MGSPVSLRVDTGDNIENKGRFFEGHLGAERARLDSAKEKLGVSKAAIITSFMSITSL